jgi:hypothetical protein
MNIINYNIHDKLKIQVRADDRFDLFNSINDSLNYFHVDDIDEPDITLNINKFVPMNDGCCTIDNIYYVKKNYFYCKDSNGSLKWEAEIAGFEEGKQEINFHYTSTSPNVMLNSSIYHGHILMPLIYKKLFDNGSFMLRAAGIVKDGDAYIFPGLGGSSKTSILMNLLKSGRYRFLGNDHVILDKNTVLNFPTRLKAIDHIYNHEKNERLTILDKLTIMNRSPTKVNIPLAGSGQLKVMFFLIRGNGNKLNISDLGHNMAIDKLITGIEMETNDQFAGHHTFPYHKYVQIYSYIFPDSKLSHYRDDLKRALSTLLLDVKKYEITVPDKCNNICNAINPLIKV